MQNHVYIISKRLEEFGVSHAIICPGSRSAPLVYAFANSKKIKCHSVIDERSAGYIALGMAQQLKKPVALICTSGTASLNFFPAIAEAYFQRIPLIVITADRPPELINMQDGQMIFQKAVYGKHVLASFETPCYNQEKTVYFETEKIVADACAIATGNVLGPVHINVPLSEPLYPTKNEKPFLPANKNDLLQRGHLVKRSGKLENQIKNISNAFLQSKKTLIVVGQNTDNNFVFSYLLNLGRFSDVVIIADVLSNAHGVCNAPMFDVILSKCDQDILDQLRPDLLISFGGNILSKSLTSWLKKQKPKHHFRIQPEPKPIDTFKNITECIYEKPENILRVLSLLKKENVKEENSFKNSWTKPNAEAKKLVSGFLKNSLFSEFQAANIVLESVPSACNVHLANSSIIRYASLGGKLHPSWVISGNRGTSGIDGCTSSAVGASVVNNKLTVLFTGDIAFLYDKNALWNNLISDNLRVIVFNNFGGGIFQIIDGPSSQKNFVKYFTTPHNHTVKNIVKESGLDYYFCNDALSLKKALTAFFKPTKKSAVLEIGFNMNESSAIFNLFKKIKLTK